MSITHNVTSISTTALAIGFGGTVSYSTNVILGVPQPITIGADGLGHEAWMVDRNCTLVGISGFLSCTSLTQDTGNVFTGTAGVVVYSAPSGNVFTALASSSLMVGLLPAPFVGYAEMRNWRNINVPILAGTRLMMVVFLEGFAIPPSGLVLDGVTFSGGLTVTVP